MLYRNVPMGVGWYVVAAVIVLLLVAVFVVGLVLLLRGSGRGVPQRQAPGYPPMPAGPPHTPGALHTNAPGPVPPGPVPLPYPNASPEDILAQRFARGEIDEAEFQARMKVLGEHRTGG